MPCTALHFPFTSNVSLARLLNPEYSPQAASVAQTHVIAEQVVTDHSVAATSAVDHDFVMLRGEPAFDATKVETDRVVAEAL